MDNGNLISLMESEDVSKEVKKSLKELTSKKNQMLKGLIESYKQLNEVVFLLKIDKFCFFK